MARIQVSCDPEPKVSCGKSPPHIMGSGPFHVKEFQASNAEYSYWKGLNFDQQEKIRYSFRQNGTCVLCSIDAQIKH